MGKDANKNIYDTFFSKSIYTTFSADEDTDAAGTAPHDISCEGSAVDNAGAFTTSYGPSSNRDVQLACINKNDWVMALNVKIVAGSSVGQSSSKAVYNDGGTFANDEHETNPRYVNMYKVNKVGREENYVRGSGEEVMRLRNRIELDKGFNSYYNGYSGAGVDGASGAQTRSSTSSCLVVLRCVMPHMWESALFVATATARRVCVSASRATRETTATCRMLWRSNFLSSFHLSS